jgi:serine protease Do
MGKMKISMNQQWKSLRTRIGAAVLALALIGSVGGYELVKPAAANASAAAPAAPALDDQSVSALVSLDHAMETLASHVTPAVVNVTVTAKHKPSRQQQEEQGPLQQFFGPFGFGQQMQQGPQIEHGLGSGIIISPDGYIVTNNHVIEGETDIRVTMNNRQVFPAKLIGADPLTDLAVIKINGSNLPSIPWGDSGTLQPGLWIPFHGHSRHCERIEPRQSLQR